MHWSSRLHVISVMGESLGVACGPAGEQLQGVLGRRSGFGAVGVEHCAGVGEQLEHVELDSYVPDDAVVDLLRAGFLLQYVVGAPAGAEFVTARGEFSDEVREVPV